ncbi:hypothetical protein Q3A66_04210 [Hymenobacter sp. BT770]|uniref:hypothetical protein n=1 Tax=Hymenobacter sp. BT770 TaxID=2886942 RepID=UPI001D0F6235|nr:hypothetical protein [Hymenobacter sp. BT770]MCC3153265.1 hypothetical protein [Hymenobacter sp. BT770]MDO3414260.1 hypothetical protein [Hymenobacter sp. BT770]
MRRSLPLYLSLLLLTQCSKCKNDPRPLDPAAQLPPATQTGAGTFGCLVNGQPYTPQGRVGLGPNFDVSYDPGFNGGDLVVRTYRVLAGEKKALAFNAINITSPGSYPFGPRQGEAKGSFDDDNRALPCNEFEASRSGTFSKGTLTITRLNLQTGIISGTFDYTLAKPGCDTIKVTQGRFDDKL